MLPSALFFKFFESVAPAAALRIRRVCSTGFLKISKGPTVRPFPINVLISPLAELWIPLLWQVLHRQTLPLLQLLLHACCENNIKIYDDKLSTPAAKICKARKKK